MSANKLNVIQQYDTTWEYEVSAGEDKPTATIAYTDDFQGWASRCPEVNSAHPDITSLKLDKIKAKRIEGDQIQVTLSYVAMLGAAVPGKPASTEEAMAKYYVQISNREEHILTNPYAAGLDDAELKALFAISNGTEADESGTPYENAISSTEGLSLLAKIRKGNVAYKTGTIIYGQRKVITTLEDLQFPDFGKRNEPPGPVGGTAANWLYVSASADPVSTDQVAWQCDRQWEYSPDGWDADLYTTPTP
jgi:hypothetical protein